MNPIYRSNEVSLGYLLSKSINGNKMNFITSDNYYLLPIGGQYDFR